jgi:hypothetical protein
MSQKSRFVLLSVAAVIISLLLSWLAFHPRVSAVFSVNAVIITFVLIVGIAPIYPLYLQVRKRSALHAVFILLVIGVSVSAVVYIVASWIFHIDSPWVSFVSNINIVLLLAACAMGIWNGLVKSKSITDK